MQYQNTRKGLDRIGLSTRMQPAEEVLLLLTNQGNNKNDKQQQGEWKEASKEILNQETPTSLENLCPFKIRLKLEEGKNWVVKKMHTKQQEHHNHMNLDKSELVTQRAHLVTDSKK